MPIESVMLSNYLVLCCPLLLPSVFPSIKVISKESAICIRWPKYWSFSISPFNEYSGLISFRIDWFDLLAVQETLKNLLQQHHSSKASILWCCLLYGPTLTFLHDLYGPTLTSEHDYWKNNSFDYMDFVGKLLSLLLNTLSRFVIAFLPRRKHFLILWLSEVTFQNPEK